MVKRSETAIGSLKLQCLKVAEHCGESEKLSRFLRSSGFAALCSSLQKQVCLGGWYTTITERKASFAAVSRTKTH